VPAHDKRAKSLEEAKIRKVEAEATAIRIRALLLPVVVIVGALELHLSSHLAGWLAAL
jgi:ABC-type uncharacterized transport system permease subunit